MEKRNDFKAKIDKHVNKDEYLNKINEWQEHQYDPGHYTGGNVPPILTHPGRPSIIGWLFVVLSIIFCIFTITMVVKGFDREQILPITAVVALTFGFYTIQFIAGVRLIQKGRLQNKAKVHNKKLIILTVSTLVISVLLVLGVYRLNNHYDAIVITSIEQVGLKQVDNNNYVYIKSIDKTLSCSIDEYFSLWSLKINNDSQKKDTSFRLEFVWNNFSPKQGKITKIIR